jgi:hypothetical protein
MPRAEVQGQGCIQPKHCRQATVCARKDGHICSTSTSWFPSPHRTSASMTCVSNLSLTSSPASANGTNMVSPDKTMFSARVMRASPSPDRPSSNQQSLTVHGDGKKRVVRCLDEDLASTKQAAPVSRLLERPTDVPLKLKKRNNVREIEVDLK